MTRLKLTRRRLIAAGAGLLGTAAGLGGYAFAIEPVWLAFERRDLPIRGLPDHWEGRTIVQLSDLHVGTQVDSDYLIHGLERINAIRPDLVVITGDFMSCRADEQVAEVGRVLGRLRPPPLGTLAVLGNHDYALRWNRLDVAETLVDRLSRLGIATLRNEAHDADGLRVFGLDDLWAGRNLPWTLADEFARGGPAIALCHNPDAVDTRGWTGYRGWILAGHTHGGQCKPPFLPPPILPVKNRRYTSGAFELSGGRRLYINRGIGQVKHVRFNVRPEVTVFTARAAALS